MFEQHAKQQYNFIPNMWSGQHSVQKLQYWPDKEVLFSYCVNLFTRCLLVF